VSKADDAAARLRSGPKLDPAGADFWDLRFREGFIPWDAGGVPAALQAFLAREPAGRRVLVPGCGSGYEVRAFAAAGHGVLAIDFSAAAIDAARRVAPELGHLVVHGDFFAHPLGSFDLVYERAFLCALPRAHWPRWAARVAEIVPPGGRLVGFFFWSDDERGPPFGLKAGELEALLAPAFVRIDDAAVADSIPVFAGRERWQVWQRR
jgi:SAM-dependent methyltransferase